MRLSVHWLSAFMVGCMLIVPSMAQVTLTDRLQVEHSYWLDRMRASFTKLRDPYRVPPKAHVIVEHGRDSALEMQGDVWRRDVPVTLFWIGKNTVSKDSRHRRKNPWDPQWVQNYGGVDDPVKRDGYLPAAFTPRLTPFYIALPYNDLEEGTMELKPEVEDVVPWFWRVAKTPRKSICKGRWVAIHFGHRVCYAQWEACGPFYTDDYAYVFQNHRPKPNRNGNAGLNMSPAVRDFLRVQNGQRVSWKFVEAEEVPSGPWSSWLNR